MEGYVAISEPVNSWLEEGAVDCPFCCMMMVPKFLSGVKIADSFTRKKKGFEHPGLVVFSVCTNKSCKHPFLTVFKYLDHYDSEGELYTMYNDIEVYFYDVFDEDPEELEPYINLIDKRPFYETFIDIYKQASIAEKNELDHIAGMGFRKAFEFLIKDYAIYLNSVDTEKIIDLALGKVIENYLKENNTMLQIAKRATWLGNDETHYQRKWPEKDIRDLKNLIILTSHTIEQAELIKQYLVEMPSKK